MSPQPEAGWPDSMENPGKAKAARPAAAVPAPKRQGPALHTTAGGGRVTVRCSRNDRALLQRAAAGRGQTLGAYVIETACAAARADREAAGEVGLAAADQQKFVALLVSPPPLNVRMRRARDRATAAAAAR